MDELSPILSWASKVGVVSLLGAAVYGLLKEYVVPGSTHRRELAAVQAQLAEAVKKIGEMAAERDRALDAKDEWKEMYQHLAESADQLRRVVEPEIDVPLLPEPKHKPQKRLR